VTTPTPVDGPANGAAIDGATQHSSASTVEVAGGRP